MKKLSWLIVFLVATQVLWAQFYQEFSSQERKELANAYYLVGGRYKDKGDTNKGDAFQEMAYNINPYLNPNDIVLTDLPSAAALILSGEARLLKRAEAQAESIEELIRSKFIRLISSFITADIEAFLSLLDGSVYLTRFSTEVTQQQIREEMGRFFASTSLGGQIPSEIYDMNSLKIERVAPITARNWGETYSLSITAKKDFSSYIGIWESRQNFLIRRTGEQWLIFSIGQGFPPSSWAPRPAPMKKVVVSASAGPAKDIEKAFLDCMDAFLAKEVDRASEYFADTIQILRLNTSLTRKEMAETFQGYFENSDFSGVTNEDLVNKNSIFVEPSDQLRELRTKPVYLLTVKTEIDLSDRIPFWTRFQDYYFSEERGVWKVFAIF